MKRQVKVLILSILMLSGLFFMIINSVLQGAILMVMALLGVYIIEARQVKRTVDYFEPLLFRCGRLEYVEEGIELLNARLLFKKLQSKQMLHLELGVMNIKGQYNDVLERTIDLGEGSVGNRRAIVTELNYAQLKLGKVTKAMDATTYREELVASLALIQEDKNAEAIEALLQLREKETGNIIFREVNELLAHLYSEINPESSQYYKMIAETFASEMTE